MKIETLTYIEVENLENIWAVQLHECIKEMKPVIPKFIVVHNEIHEREIIFVDNTLTDSKPEKIIPGVTGGISDHFIEVGFWRFKKSKN